MAPSPHGGSSTPAWPTSQHRQVRRARSSTPYPQQPSSDRRSRASGGVVSRLALDDLPVVGRQPQLAAADLYGHGPVDLVADLAALKRPTICSRDLVGHGSHHRRLWAWVANGADECERPMAYGAGRVALPRPLPEITPTCLSYNPVKAIRRRKRSLPCPRHATPIPG